MRHEWIHIRHLLRDCCDHMRWRMSGRAFHGHDIACQATQGQQQHHEQGKKAAHGGNDKRRRQKFLRQGLLEWLAGLVSEM